MLLLNNCTGILNSVNIKNFDTPFLTAQENSRIYLNNMNFLLDFGERELISSISSIINLNFIKIDLINSTFIKLSSFIKTYSDSHINISNSDINDLIVNNNNNNNNLIFEGRIKCLNLNNCKFRNITWSNSLCSKNNNVNRLNNKERNSCSFMKIEQCYYKQCDSPFYGCITSPSGVISSSTSNSSFISCYQHIDERRQVFTSGDHNFSDDSFISITAQGVNGGAFCFNGANAFFSFCYFFRCETSNYESFDPLGGAVYLENGIFECENSNFSTCFANGGDHFLSLHSPTQLLVNDCIFDTCNGNWLGGVGIEKTPDCSVLCWCSISNVSTNVYGAGLVLEYIDNLITVSECYFMNNRAVRTASGVYFYRQNNTARFKFIFDKFSSNSYIVGDISFHSDYKDKSWHSKENFICCLTDNHERSVGQCEKNGMDDFCLNITYLDYLIIYSYSTLTVDSSVGLDEFNCGRNDSDILCNTLNYALKFFFSVRDSFEVFIQNEAIEDTVLNFRNMRVYVNSISISSEKNNRPKLSLRKNESEIDTLITILNSDVYISNIHLTIFDNETETSSCIICKLNSYGGRITFQNCTLSGREKAPDISTVNHHLNGFKVINGSLILENTDFANFSLGNNPFFEFDSSQSSKSYFDISKCTFTNIERIEGDGCIFSQTLNEYSLNISNISFINCNVLKGDGGVMNIMLNEGSRLIVGNGYYNTSFVSCKAMNDGNMGGRGGGICLHANCSELFTLENIDFINCEARIEGRNLFVYSFNLYETISNNNIKFNLVDKRRSEMGFIDDTNTTSIFISDILGIFIPPAYVSLGGNASDEGLCGKEIKPCLTIEKAVEVRYSDTTSTAEICLMNGFIFKDEVNANGRMYSFSVLEEEEEEEDEVVFVGGEGSGAGNCLVNINTEVRFTGISFHLLESIGTKVSFLDVKENITVIDKSSVSFIEELGKSIEYSFCCVEGGTLIMMNVSMKGKTRNISLTKSLVIINSTGNMNITECEFGSLSLTNEDGSCINGNINEGCKLIISRTSFVGCETINGNGGGINVVVGEDSTFKIIDNSIFKSCSASDSHTENSNEGPASRCGGAIYLDLSQITKPNENIVLSGISFGKSEEGNANVAYQGTDIYVYAINFGVLTRNNNFPFLDNYGTDEDTSAIGQDDGSYQYGEKLSIILGYKPDSEAIYISSFGSDEAGIGEGKGDGSSEYPYKSIHYANGEIGDKTKILVRSTSSLMLTTEKSSTSFINNVEICHESAATLITLPVESIDGEYLFMIKTTSILVSFTYIRFELSKHNPSLSIFSVNDGKLTLSSCLFLREESPSGDLDHSLISLNGGECEIQSFMFTLLSFSSSSCVEVKNGSLNITEGNFEGITSKTGNGVAINVIIRNGYKISISRNTFKTCYTNSGLGGAIYLSIPSELTTGDILISEITFGSSFEEKNKALFGDNLFVSSYLFTSDVITKLRFPVIDIYNGNSENTLKGCWSSDIDSTNKYYNLADLYKTDDGKRYIGSNGNDRNNGFVNTPYLTIHGAYSQMNTISTFYIINDLNKEILKTEIDRSFNIEPKEPGDVKVSLKVGILQEESDRMFNELTSVVLFTINPSQKESIIDFSRIKFLIQHFQGTIPKESIISIIQGNVNINNCEFLIDRNENGGDKELDKLIKSVVIISGGLTVFSSCIFRNLELSVGNGAALSANLNGDDIGSYDSLIIKGSLFSGCSANEGVGGAVCVFISGYGEFYIDKTTESSSLSNTEDILCKFGNCKVDTQSIGEDEKKGSKGRGGAIYVSTNSVDSKININNIIFGDEKLDNNFVVNDEDKENCGVEGHDMFVIVVNLDKFYEDNKEFFDNYDFKEEDRNDIVGVSLSADFNVVWFGYFIVGLLEEIEVEDEGTDVNWCGSELFPCHSLEKAFERQGKDKKVYIKSNLIVEKDILFDDYCYLINGEDKKGNLIRRNDHKYINISVGDKKVYDGVFNSRVDVTFNYLTFSVPFSLKGRESLFEHSHIESTSSTLTLSNCVFEKKNEEVLMKNEEEESVNIDYGLINVISGNICINNMSVSDMKFIKSAVIVEKESMMISVDCINLSNDEFDNGLFDIRVKDDVIRSININNLNIDGIILNNNPLFIYNNSSPSSYLLSKESERNEESSKVLLCKCKFKNIHLNREGESNIIFSSSSSLSPSLDMNECTFDNITVTPDRNTGSIVSISSYSANMTNCSFNGKEEEQQQKEEEICSWDGSIIEVNKGIAIFDGCTIANSSKGGINIKEGSNVTLKGCILDNNNPKYTKYGSVRRNIICSSSTLKGEEMKEKETDSLWILNNKCSFEGLDEYSSLLFIPSINNVSYIDEANENNAVNVTFEGNLLLPCNLSLKVIESDEKNTSINYFAYSFSSFENENKASAFISYPFLFSSNSSHSLSVSLLYSDGREGQIIESKPFIFREGKNEDDGGGGTDKDKDKDKDKSKSSSVTWIIVGSVLGFVFIVIIIIIIIIIIIYKKRSIPLEEEKKEEEMIEGTEVKEEMAINPWSEEDKTKDKSEISSKSVNEN